MRCIIVIFHRLLVDFTSMLYCTVFSGEGDRPESKIFNKCYWCIYPISNFHLHLAFGLCLTTSGMESNSQVRFCIMQYSPLARYVIANALKLLVLTLFFVNNSAHWYSELESFYLLWLPCQPSFKCIDENAVGYFLRFISCYSI